MTDKNRNSGPAFPQAIRYKEGGVHSWNGMTMRDYFAGQALVGILSNEGWSKDIAQMAYAVAEEMLVAREAQ